MEALFASGRIVDLILALVALEAAALWAWGRWRASGLPGFPDLLPNLLAGACLLVALRGALAGAPWPWIAAPLALSLLAHLADLRRRGVGPRRSAPR